MAHFAVSPKNDCPHQDSIENLTLSSAEFFGRVNLSSQNIQSQCATCGSQEENWLCVECLCIFCSRYVQGHMAEHNQATRHKIAFSLSDSSFWCYECDSYVTSLKLRLLAQHFETIKFAEESKMADQDEDEDEDAAREAVEALRSAHLSSLIPFTRQELLEGLAGGKYKKIAVLTGAGISVAAGIPDFRTPGTGLYAQLATLGLPQPELFFDLSFFSQNPEPFYSVASTLLAQHARPVQAHYFIQQLQQQGVLLYQYTQNIDGLELAAGVSLDKLVQAHGHMRTARCIACRSEAVVEDFLSAVREQRILRCLACEGMQNYVKPDIVFFGESLPENFFDKAMEIQEADLLIIMGTSLKVFPFAMLPSLLAEDTPVVMINRENPGMLRDRFLFLAGDIEDTIASLARDLQWTLGPQEMRQA